MPRRYSTTTYDQPYGVYDIEYYESPYETFFCLDYGALRLMHVLRTCMCSRTCMHDTFADAGLHKHNDQWRK